MKKISKKLVIVFTLIFSIFLLTQTLVAYAAKANEMDVTFWVNRSGSTPGDIIINGKKDIRYYDGSEGEVTGDIDGVVSNWKSWHTSVYYVDVADLPEFPSDLKYYDYSIEVTFDTTVFGKTGTITMQIDYRVEYWGGDMVIDENPTITGMWKIVDGGFDLADIKGQGKMDLTYPEWEFTGTISLK